MNAIRKNKIHTTGFSLVEVLVAISVLVTAVTGTLFVATKSISFAGAATDRVVAFYLAQEAAEFVKNTRDNNIIAGSNWLSGLSSCVGSACVVDVPNDDTAACNGDCPFLLRSSAGLYNYDVGTPTIFRREVTLTEVSTNKEMTVDVVLRFKRGTIERTTTIREHLFNWN